MNGRVVSLLVIGAVVVGAVFSAYRHRTERNEVVARFTANDIQLVTPYKRRNYQAELCYQYGRWLGKTGEPPIDALEKRCRNPEGEPNARQDALN